MFLFPIAVSSSLPVFCCAGAAADGPRSFQNDPQLPVHSSSADAHHVVTRQGSRLADVVVSGSTRRQGDSTHNTDMSARDREGTRRSGIMGAAAAMRSRLRRGRSGRDA
jgi:hypothetical protein